MRKKQILTLEEEEKNTKLFQEKLDKFKKASKKIKSKNV